MNLEFVALDFYDRNCIGCKERRPVRLPNLLQLVERRDRERTHHEEQAQLAVQEEATRVEARTTRRRAFREGGDQARAGIFDILDRLDRAPSEADHRILLETAKAASDKFDAAVQEALFELVEAGGWTRTEAALEALALVTSDRNKLTEAALRALARYEALRTAGSIVSKWLDASHRQLLPPAMPTLIHLTSPITGLGDFWTPGDPEPVLAVYRLFSDIVHAGIREMLQEPDKHPRIDACHAAAAIIEVDPDFGPKVAGDLIRSVRLPDDGYGAEGSAGHAVAHTLAEAMKVRPTAIDALVQRAFASVSDAEATILFRTYTELLRSSEMGKSQGSVTHADQLGFHRIVEILVQRPVDGRFEEAASFVGHQAQYHPNYLTLLAAEAETLLGAAALIAGDLDTPYSPLSDPRPDTLKALEAQTRELHLDTALRAVVQAVGQAAFQKPRLVGSLVVQTLERLEERHDRLKAALVQCLGTMGQSQDGLAVALPALYTAMMDRSQRVRAAAATAYGELVERASEDMPSLIHESFLVLLFDPYVIVHRAALRALRRRQLPERFRMDVFSRVALLIGVYAASKSDDRFLSECIERLMDVCGPTDTLISQTLQAFISIINQMEPQEAARLIKYRGGRLRSAPGFSDLVVKLLADPGIYEGDLDDLVEELAEVAAEDICRLGDAIRVAAAACARRGTDLTDDILDILTKAGAWSVAAAVAQEASNRLGDTPWDRPRKLRAMARQVAAELELAAAVGQTDQVLACTARWRKLHQEIKKDNRGERRDPKPSTRFTTPESR